MYSLAFELGDLTHLCRHIEAEPSLISIIFVYLRLPDLPANTGKRIVVVYTFIALQPNAPATAEATAIITFRIMSHTDFFIAIIYLLSDSFK